MKLTRNLAAAVIGAASFAVAGSAAAETELVVVSWGGAYSASQQNAYHAPYMEANPGIKIINDDSAPEAVAKLRAMNEVGKVTWDQCRDIAQQKIEDLNATDLDNAARMIAGTARSMGLTVTGAPIVD